MLENFSPAAGRQLTPKSNPAIAAPLWRMQPDIRSDGQSGKAIWHRLRPYHLDNGKICQRRDQVPDCDYRILGTRSELLRTLTAASGVEAAVLGVVVSNRNGAPDRIRTCLHSCQADVIGLG